MEHTESYILDLWHWRETEKNLLLVQTKSTEMLATSAQEYKETVNN